MQNMLNAKKKLAAVSSVIAILFLVLYMASSNIINNDRGGIISKFNEAESSLVEGGITKIRIENTRKVCIQPPYASKSDFERLTKESVDNYKTMQSDGMLAIHIFYKNGTSEVIQFDGKVIRLDRDGAHNICSEAGEIRLKRSGTFVLVGLPLI